MQARRRPEARAALSAALAGFPDRVEPWVRLFNVEIEDGRWAEAADLAEAATRWHADDPAPAVLRAKAFLMLGRLEEAVAALSATADRFTSDIESLDLLSDIMSVSDPVECVRVVEAVVARGMVGRDHVVLRGVNCAAYIGEFARARALLAHVSDAGVGERSAAKLRSQEEEWSTAEALWTERFPEGASVVHIEGLVADGEITLGVHAAIRKMLTGCSADEHDHLVHVAHRFGLAGGLTLNWVAYTAGRRGAHPIVVYHYVPALISRGAFHDAGRHALLARPDRVEPDYLLRLKTFCCAGGALSREALADAVLAYDGAQLAAADLARAYLLNSGSVEPWAVAERGTASLSSGATDSVGPYDAVRRMYRSPRQRRPRVAICVSGQLRSFRKSWPHTRRALSEWEPTVFVSTWRDVGMGFGMHDTVDRLLPPGVKERLPPAALRKTLFERQMPRVIAVMAKTDAVERSELQAFYGTEFVTVNDEPAFEVRWRDHPGLYMYGSLNQAKMFFTIADVNAMKARHEEQEGYIFDAVLRVRPDRTMVSLGEHDVQRVSTSRTLLSDYFMLGGIGDQGTLCSSEVADRIGDIWPGLERAGHSSFFPGSSGRFNEFLLADYLIYRGVNFGRYAATHSMGITHLEPELAPLWHAVLDEAETEGASPEQRAVFLAFIEAAAEAYEQTRAADLVLPVPGLLFEPTITSGLSERAIRFLSACPRRRSAP